MFCEGAESAFDTVVTYDFVCIYLFYIYTHIASMSMGYGSYRYTKKCRVNISYPPLRNDNNNQMILYTFSHINNISPTLRMIIKAKEKQKEERRK